MNLVNKNSVLLILIATIPVWLLEASLFARQKAERPPAISGFAPDLTLDQFLEPDKAPFDPRDVDREDLEGKVIVIDFSTTWCLPCIAAFPHMNDLTEEFKDRNVIFITVTNEDKSRAVRLRDDLGLKTHIAIDRDGSTFWDYWVPSLPLAVVIDTNGRIAAITDEPTTITSDFITALLDKKPVGMIKGAKPELARVNWSTTDSHPRVASDGQDSALAGSIKLIEVGTANFRGRVDKKSGIIKLPGFPAKLVVSVAFDSRLRLDIQATLPERSRFFSVEVVPPDSDIRTARRMLRSAIKEAFDLRILSERRRMDVLSLRRNASPILLKPSKMSSLTSSLLPGRMTLQGASSDEMAELISGVMSKIVVNDSGLAGRYDVDLSWAPEDSDELIKILRELGLNLENKSAEIEIFVVRSK